VTERETKKEKEAGVCITVGRIARNEANSLHAAMHERNWERFFPASLIVLRACLVSKNFAKNYQILRHINFWTHA
jgi:hypothetical protein